MQANSFLIINGIIVLFFVVRLFSGRKPDRPTPLQIHNPFPPQAKPNYDAHLDKKAPGTSGERLLNFPFQYGEKQHDLFFVLNVPIGASKEMCVKALLALKSRPGSDPQFVIAIEKAIREAFPIS